MIGPTTASDSVSKDSPRGRNVDINAGLAQEEHRLSARTRRITLVQPCLALTEIDITTSVHDEGAPNIHDAAGLPAEEIAVRGAW